MVDFEQIGDTFEEGFEKVKDFTKKNKVLTIAICGVGGFALYKYFATKTNSEDTEYVSTYAYVPTAYDGYPTMSESVSYDDVVDQMRTETSDITENFYHETMSDVSQMIDDAMYENNKKFDALFETMNAYDENLTTMSYLEEQRQKQAIIDRMSANSEAWHTASDEEKERLHQENVVLGTILGADFDSASGTWSQDGYTLYDVPIKNKTNTSTANLTNVGVTETPVPQSEIIAQMKANSEAWHTASDTEKARLEAENKQLGSQIGATFNATKGTWTDSNHNSLYSVNPTANAVTGSTPTNVSTVSTKKSNSSGSVKTTSTTTSSGAKSTTVSGNVTTGTKIGGSTVAHVSTNPTTGQKTYYDKNYNLIGRS